MTTKVMASEGYGSVIVNFVHLFNKIAYSQTSFHSSVLRADVG